MSQNTVDSSTIDKKILCGYQGWFAAEGDGSKLDVWDHWASDTKTQPTPTNVVVDMWPDLREFGKDELFASGFTFSNNSPANTYSAYNEKTVDRHVKWMKDYGIDGVIFYRFVTAVKNQGSSKFEHRTQVLKNMKKGCENYGRVFAVKYDISDADEGTLVDNIKNDWMYLVDTLKITQSNRYLHEKGRPIVSLSGFGYDNRSGQAEQLEQLIEWFHNGAADKYKATLLGGVNRKWNDPQWEDYNKWNTVYKKFDILCPWCTGSYSDNNGIDNYRKNNIEPELAACKAANIIYMPVIFPGFSWHNLKSNQNPQPALNSIPRAGGNFLWRQAYNAVDAGAKIIFAAMFDEVNEGTALFKLAENKDQIPSSGAFVPLDADGYKLGSDWYLRLVGAASSMVRGEIGVTNTIPIKA